MFQSRADMQRVDPTDVATVAVVAAVAVALAIVGRVKQQLYAVHTRMLELEKVTKGLKSSLARSRHCTTGCRYRPQPGPHRSECCAMDVQAVFQSQ